MTPNESRRVRLHPAQRFDRDAVKAMLVDGLRQAAFWKMECRVDQAGDIQVSDADSVMEFGGDDFADTVIEWFGGKGAA